MATDHLDRAGAEQYAEQSFALLEALSSKNGWERLVGQSTWWLIVDDAFFEVELDLREQSAFALCGPLREGRRPRGYYLDENRKRARWHVSAALALAGLEQAEKAPPAPRDATPAERLQAAVDANRPDVETALSHLDQVMAACRTATGG